MSKSERCIWWCLVSREAEVLRQWLFEAWDMGVDAAYIARQVEEGMPLTDAVQEMRERLGMERVSVRVDSFLPAAPEPHSQPKPCRSGRG